MTGAATRPRYRDLPHLPDGTARCSWGVWPEPARGAWADLDPASVTAAVAEVATGQVVRVDVPPQFFDPPLFARPRTEHQVRGKDDDFARDDLVDSWNTQSASHWDGFRHVRESHGFYGGLPGHELGVEHLARTGLVARAVLADVAAYRASAGRPLDPTDAAPIDVADLEATLAAQKSELRRGDVLLVRTGWLTWYRDAGAAARSDCARRDLLRAPGLMAGADMAEWLWDAGVVAVAVDNPSGEVWPLLTGAADQARSLHLDLLVALGIPLGELWDFDELARASMADGRFSALLVSAPLAFAGACAAPANAVVVR